MRDIRSHHHRWFIVSHSCPLNFNSFYHSHSCLSVSARITLRSAVWFGVAFQKPQINALFVLNADASESLLCLCDLYVCSTADRREIGKWQRRNRVKELNWYVVASAICRCCQIFVGRRNLSPNQSKRTRCVRKRAACVGINDLRLNGAQRNRFVMIVWARSLGLFTIINIVSLPVGCLAIFHLALFGVSNELAQTISNKRMWRTKKIIWFDSEIKFNTIYYINLLWMGKQKHIFVY